MQITITSEKDPNISEDFTLMAVGESYTPNERSSLSYTVQPDAICSLCGNAIPEWFVSPASPSAMDGDASPIGAGDSCSNCVNKLLNMGEIRIDRIEPGGF